MKFGKIATTVIAVLAVSLSISAGEGKKRRDGPDREGPIQNILEHAKELNLTAEQKTKLEALQKDIAGKIGGGDLREKFKDNPEARELFKAAKEARESGNEAKIKEARENLREFAMKNGGAGDGPGEGKGGEFREKIAGILTPEQMIKVKALMEENRSKMKEPRKDRGGDKDDKGQKPDTSREAPKIFE